MNFRRSFESFPVGVWGKQLRETSERVMDKLPPNPFPKNSLRDLCAIWDSGWGEMVGGVKGRGG